MDTRLIEQVRLHRFLYDTSMPDYRDIHSRYLAWEEIGQTLQITANEAKQRWDRLRRCFYNSISRRREHAKNGIKTKAQWRHEKNMSFVVPFMSNRVTRINAKDSSTDIFEATKLDDPLEGSDVEENTSFQAEQVNVEMKTENNSVQDIQTTDDEAPTNDTKPFEKHYNPMKCFQNKKQKLPDGSELQMVQILKDNHHTLRKHQYEENNTCRTACNTNSFIETLDNTDLFFLSMSRMTKQLPKPEQTQIKLALSNSVLSSELRCNQK